MLHVVAVHLDCHLGTNTCNQLIHAHLHGLSELVVVAGNGAHRLLQFGEQYGPRLAWIGPFAAILQHDEGVSDRRRHGVGRNLCGADLGDDFLHLGKLLDPGFQLALHANRLRQTRSGDTHRVQGDVAFIQVRDELGSQACCKQAGQHHQHCRCRDDGDSQLNRLLEKRCIEAADAAHHLGFLLGNLAGDKQGDRSGHEGQRQHHRAGQGDDDGQGHRMEHLSFHARQREDRKVNSRDDEQPEQGGLDDFRTGTRNQRETLIAGQQATELVLSLAEPAQAVLHDDDRAIDDQAEVQRAQAHQIGRDTVLHHAGNRQQHGKRNHGSSYQSCPHVAQQQEKHCDHQQCAFQKILLHGGDGAINELRAVVNRMRADSLGKCRVDFSELFHRALRNRSAVLANQHEGRTQHDLLAVFRCSAGSQFAAFQHFRHIAHSERKAIARCHDNLPQPLYVAHLAGNADQILFAMTLDVPGTDVRVVARDGVQHVVHRQPVGQQLDRIGRDVELAHAAADGVDLGDAFQVAKLRTH